MASVNFPADLVKCEPLSQERAAESRSLLSVRLFYICSIPVCVIWKMKRQCDQEPCLVILIVTVRVWGTAVTQPFLFQLMDINSPPESSRVYLQSEDEAGGAVNNKTPSSCIHPVLTALIQYTMTELPDGSIFHLLSGLKMTELLRQLVPSFCLCRVETDHEQTVNVLRSSECRWFHTEHQWMMWVVCCGLHRYEHRWEIFFFRPGIRNVAGCLTTHSPSLPSVCLTLCCRSLYVNPMTFYLVGLTSE